MFYWQGGMKMEGAKKPFHGKKFIPNCPRLKQNIVTQALQNLQFVEASFAKIYSVCGSFSGITGRQHGT